MKFQDYVQQKDNHVTEMISYDSIKKFAKKWPASIAAGILGTGVIGLSKVAEKMTDDDHHPTAEVEVERKLKPGLPPLPKNPKPPKIIKRIEDAGKV